MQKLATKIVDFISQNSETLIIENPDGFPNSPYTYLFLPEKNLVVHCVTLEFLTDEPTFFQNLTNEFSQKNLKLIHLWEDVWQSKQAIVKSRLLSLLGKSETIPARLTQVRRIDKPTLDKFLIINHLQGTVAAKLKYGLFLPKKYFRVIKEQKLVQKSADLKEILVAVASFSNAKKIIREGQTFRSYELIRFANLKEITVVGGFNKLLKNFIQEQNPDDIMTYADADWSDGSNYEKLGFERIEQTQPLSFMLDNQTLMREICPYDGFPNPSLPCQVCNLTHRIEKSLRLYNAGNWKFLMKLKHE